ncbi:MAG TPA: tripartite tricarboxylate transporter substrate binding protein [Burkholderiales bacterium]|nr:tripartite tricarboxylate transporter substrate binding protein [Burkholderiales bacterium]
MQLCTVLLAAGSVYAQSYPAKPLRFIIPFPPGGPTDIVGRLAAERLSRNWNVQVVADNRPGQGGNIGTEQCARAPADGYTMCMISIAQSISPAIYPKLGFDPVRDFAHVTLLATLPSLLVVHPSLPVKNVGELIAFAKGKPGALNYASGGSGTSSHLLMEMFNQQAGIDTVHVKYKGTGPAIVDQLSGRIEIAFSTAIAVLPYVQAGRLRALAVSTRERLPTLAGVPTIAESGLPNFDGGSWQGVVMPAGTPREHVNAVSAELVKILRAPDMKERILDMGGIPLGNTPEEFAAYMKTEEEKWARVVKAAKVGTE